VGKGIRWRKLGKIWDVEKWEVMGEK